MPRALIGDDFVGVFTPDKCVVYKQPKPKPRYSGEGTSYVFSTATDTALGDKLLGDPVAVQSSAAMVQATGVRLSPAIDREKRTTNRETTLREK